MPHLPYGDWIEYLWWIFLLVWLLTAFTAKRTQQREPRRRTAVRLLLTLLIICFLYLAPPDVRWLHRRLIPGTEGLLFTGFIMTLTGVALSIWARFALGTNWSAEVTVKKDHVLVVRGPYRLVRNPIYSGVLLALLGTAIAAGQARHFLVLPLLLGLWIWKVRGEEQLLREQFGEPYESYRRRVKAFIPYVL